MNKFNNAGWIYLLLAEGFKRYKIGRSVNPVDRHKTISKQSPFPLLLIESFWTPNAIDDEKILHKDFESYRVYGEWFEFPENFQITEEHVESGQVFEYLLGEAGNFRPIASPTIDKMLMSDIRFINDLLEKYNDTQRDPLSLGDAIKCLYLRCRTPKNINFVKCWIRNFLPLHLELNVRNERVIEPFSFIIGSLRGA